MLLPVETAVAQGATSGSMLISAARAATLKLTNQREAANPHAPVLITGGEPFDLRIARPITDPALDLGNPFKGPFKAIELDWREQATAAMELARIPVTNCMSEQVAHCLPRWIDGCLAGTVRGQPCAVCAGNPAIEVGDGGDHGGPCFGRAIVLGPPVAVGMEAQICGLA